MHTCMLLYNYIRTCSRCWNAKKPCTWNIHTKLRPATTDRYVATRGPVFPVYIMQVFTAWVKICTSRTAVHFYFIIDG